MKKPHLPVLLNEMLHYFKDSHLRVFFDGTLGAGGHARAILENHPEIELFIGCDRDPRALAIAREELTPWKEKVQFVHGNFCDLDKILASLGVEKVDGFFLT